MTKQIKKEPEKYGVEEDKIWQFEKLMFKLKGMLMDGHIFQNCIEQEYDLPSYFEVRKNLSLREGNNNKNKKKKKKSISQFSR